MRAPRVKWLRGVGRRGYRLIMMGLGGVAAILLFHFIIMPLFVRHGQETAVPDLRGLPVEEVAPLIRSAQMIPGRITEVVDEHIPAGRVTRQIPGPDLRVKRGRELALVVSRGAAALRVPDLEGESLVHARFLLAREAIEVGKVRCVASRLNARDEIIAASPPSGAPMGGRRAVDLLVSTGPPVRRFLMPDLRGREIRSVQEGLEARGFQVMRRIWRGGGDRPNQIVEQTPPPGYPVHEGGTIELMTGG